MQDNLALALNDLFRAMRDFRVWSVLAWQEIRQRYRRSTLGPFWLTISTGFMIAAMGPLYSRLFGQSIGDYFPYLASGFVVWLLLSNIANDACTVFISAENVIKQIKLPLSLHVFRTVARNILTFGHNLVVIALVMIFFPPRLSLEMLLVIPGIFLVAINGVWINLLLGMVCARFRDIPPIISSLVQVAFFLTPVMWHPDMLGKHQWAATINPLFHFVEIVRQPLIGGHVRLLTWAIILGITLAGSILTLLVFSRFRARIAYWI